MKNIYAPIVVTKDALFKKTGPKEFAEAISHQMEDTVSSTNWYFDEIVRLMKEATAARPKPYWWHWLIRSHSYKFYIYLCHKTPDFSKKPK